MANDKYNVVVKDGTIIDGLDDIPDVDDNRIFGNKVLKYKNGVDSWDTEKPDIDSVQFIRYEGQDIDYNTPFVVGGIDGQEDYLEYGKNLWELYNPDMKEPDSGYYYGIALSVMGNLTDTVVQDEPLIIEGTDSIDGSYDIVDYYYDDEINESRIVIHSPEEFETMEPESGNVKINKGGSRTDIFSIHNNEYGILDSEGDYTWESPEENDVVYCEEYNDLFIFDGDMWLPLSSRINNYNIYHEDDFYDLNQWDSDATADSDEFSSVNSYTYYYENNEYVHALTGGWVEGFAQSDYDSDSGSTTLYPTNNNMIIGSNSSFVLESKLFLEVSDTYEFEINLNDVFGWYYPNETVISFKKSSEYDALLVGINKLDDREYDIGGTVDLTFDRDNPYSEWGLGHIIKIIYDYNNKILRIFYDGEEIGNITNLKLPNMSLTPEFKLSTEVEYSDHFVFIDYVKFYSDNNKGIYKSEEA